MAEVAEKAVTAAEVGHEIVDVASDVVELGEDAAASAVSSLSANPGLMVGLGLVLGIGVGGFFGYRYAEKKLATNFEILLDEETSKVRAHYKQKLKAKQEKPTAEDVADLATVRQQQSTHRDMVDDLGYSPQGEKIEVMPATAKGIMEVVTEQSKEREAEAEELKAKEAAALEVVNAFEQRDREAEAALPPWDFAVELKARDPRKPYVIHVSEWEENENDYDKKDLTYYEGDGVICDEDDNIIDHGDEVLNLDNLNRFGHGSGDINTVFIRNDISEVLYEVARSYGSYAVEVHGFDPDQLQHSDERERRRGRTRFDDDD